jgi:Cu2+-exporting ATPase
MVGNGMGAKNGIMFKTAVSLEETGKTEIVALDKTGTITSGEPKVTDLLPADGMTEHELLFFANALEKKSEHPLARAILAKAKENGKAEQKIEITQFQAVPGNGLSGKLGEDWLYGGNFKFISDKMKISASIKEQAEQLAQQGKTPLFFGKNEQFLGMIAVADVIKEDSPQAVKELQNMGIHVVMLTGDNERTAKAIGEQAGVDEVIAGVLPEGKEQVIRKLKEKGKVAMVGDGINDAPALTRADMGIAIGAGTDIAIDAADVVLMKSRLSDVPAAIRMSRATLRNIHENLFWAFFYNAIGIPLAAGIWIPVFGWKLNPMFGAAAMSLSSFCVVTNALRLNLFKMYDASKDRKRKMKKVETAENTVSDIVLADKNESENKEETKMTKTMKIEGMMCGHCEAAVKKALEALEQVDTAEVSHEAGTAVVTLNSEISNEVLKKTVEDKDYTVTAIED